MGTKCKYAALFVFLGHCYLFWIEDDEELTGNESREIDDDMQLSQTQSREVGLPLGHQGAP